MSTRATLSDVERAWALLEASQVASEHELSARTTDWIAGGRSLSLGLDASGRRHLLVPLGIHDPFEPDRASSGVHMVDRLLLETGVRRRFIDLVCLKPHLNGLFSVLVGDVVDALARPGRADRLIRGVLERWRALLARGPTDGLSLEFWTGLFAELLILLEMAEVCPMISEAWFGPHGGRHDIVTPSGSVEVKGTLRREGRRIEIHGVEQLESPGQGALFVAFVRLERDPAGRAVSHLLYELERAGCPMEPLRAGLFRLGVNPDDSDQLQSPCFTVRERRTYLVDEQFPRIIRSSFPAGGLPSGVVSLRYEIDLNSEIPGSRSATQWLADRELLGGSLQ